MDGERDIQTQLHVDNINLDIYRWKSTSEQTDATSYEQMDATSYEQMD